MAENSQYLPIGHKISGHYEIIEVLGQGGFGIVYKVKNRHQLDEILIIKELFLKKDSFRVRGKTTVATNPGMKHIFEKIRGDIEKEVEILSSINNKNIVQEYGQFEENQTIYSIMEYIEGMDLAKYIEKHTFDEDKAIDLLKQLIHGLKEIHLRNIIHRDIKPSNIMRTKDGVYKLIDFTNNKSYMDSEITITGITSQGYSSPELWRKKAKVGAFSDIYSMGMTLIKVLTLEDPPEMADRFDDATFQKSIDELPVSSNFREIIRKMTNRKSDNRFEDLEEVEDALKVLNVKGYEENIPLKTELIDSNDVVSILDSSIKEKKKVKKKSIRPPPHRNIKILMVFIGVIFMLGGIIFLVKIIKPSEIHIATEENLQDDTALKKEAKEKEECSQRDYDTGVCKK